MADQVTSEAMPERFPEDEELFSVNDVEERPGISDRSPSVSREDFWGGNSAGSGFYDSFDRGGPDSV